MNDSQLSKHIETEAVLEPTNPEIAQEASGGILQIMPTFENLGSIITAGGPIVLILLGMSVFAATIVFAKLWQFSSAGLGDKKSPIEASALFREGRIPEARKVANGGRNPVNAVLAIAIEGLERDIPEEKVREECFREASQILESLRGWMRPLEVIASLAPLLGLFGTVLGMIEAFSQLEAAGSQVDPAILSGGIWEALLTTAVGLAVAIPVVAMANYFERQIERLEHRMDVGLASLFAMSWAQPERRILSIPKTENTGNDLRAGSLRASPAVE